MGKTKKIIRDTVNKNIFSLVGFEFIFKISAVLVFVPAIIKVLDLALKNAGMIYITNKNLMSFLKNPLMIFMAAAVFFIFLCISFYEICCVWTCIEYSAHGCKISIPDMFIQGFSGMKKLAGRYKYKTVLMMAAVFPIYHLHVMVVLFHRVDILESIIRHIFMGMRPGYIVVIFSASSVMAASLALQKLGKIFSGKELKAREFLKNTLCITAANIFTAIVLVLVYLLLVFISAVILRFFVNKRAAFAHLIGFENNIYYFLAFLGWSMGVMINTAVMYSSVPGQIGKAPEVSPVARKKSSKIKKICVTVLVILIAAADTAELAGYVINGSHLLEDMFISTTVTAHRGGAKFAPENTMYGVKYAIESGAEYIEIDVQLSADGTVFLLHDDNLKRTTGYNRDAYTMKYEDIAKLDAGSYFGSSFSDAYIPSLDEVLTECKGKIKLNIELKKTGPYGNELVDKVAELIAKHDMKEQCVITSTNYAFLKYIKKNYPFLRTGYIANMLFGNAASLEAADFFSVKYVVVTEGFVKSAHSAGKEVHVWTVNTKYLINRMKGLDVDSIITDNPVLCKKILMRKNDRRSFVEILQTLLYK